MGFLRVIWKDMLWLHTRFSPAAKIADVVFGVVLILGAWYLGAEFWMKRVSWQKFPRPYTQLEELLVWLGLFLVFYIISVIERYRKARR